jgi:hypothetical protein
VWLWIAASLVVILQAASAPIVLPRPTLADGLMSELGRSVTELVEIGGK